MVEKIDKWYLIHWTSQELNVMIPVRRHRQGEKGIPVILRRFKTTFTQLYSNMYKSKLTAFHVEIDISNTLVMSNTEASLRSTSQWCIIISLVFRLSPMQEFARPRFPKLASKLHQPQRHLLMHQASLAPTAPSPM